MTRLTWTDALVLAVLVAASSWLVFGVMGSTTGMTRSHHGLYHCASVYQVWNGIVPPTHPLSIERPAISYWGWYLLLTGFMRVFDIAALEAGIVSNALGLSLTLGGIWIGTRFLRLSAPLRFALALAPLFLVWPQRAGFVAWGIGAGRIDFLGKFVTFNGFPLGLGLTAVLLPVVLGAEAARAPRLFACALFGAVVAFLHPTTAVGVVLLALAGLLHDGVVLFRRREGARALLPHVALLVGVAALYPYMSSLRDSLGLELRVLTNPSDLVANARLTGLSLVLPSAALGFAFVRWGAIGRSGRILASTVLLLAAASIGGELPGGNQYKLDILVAIPSAYLIGALLRVGPGARAGLAACSISAALTGVAVTDTVVRFGEFPWGKTDDFAYSGTSVDLNVADGGPEARDLQEAYEWLRANTPATAYVLDRPHHGNDLVLSTVAQRRIVAAWGGQVVENIDHHEGLMDGARRLVGALELRKNPRGALLELLALPVPWPEVVYVWAENAAGLGLEATTVRGRDVGLEPLFANERVVIYRWLTGETAPPR